MPLTDIEKTAIAAGISGLQAGARRGMKTAEKIGFAQWQEEQIRSERVDVNVMDILGEEELGFMEDGKFTLWTPEQQKQAIETGVLPPGIIRRPGGIRGTREQRLELRETRLQKQFEHRQAKDRKAGNRDLFRTSLSLLRALRQEDKETPTVERRFQIDDAVDEMIRYAKRAGINIRDWIKEEYFEDRTFWDRVLRRPGAKKERLIEKPKPIPSKTPASQVTVISPEGIEGIIPRDQLNEALEQGYRLVE